MFETLDKAVKIVTRQGKRYYAEGVHSGKEVGSIRKRGSGGGEATTNAPAANEAAPAKPDSEHLNVALKHAKGGDWEAAWNVAQHDPHLNAGTTKEQWIAWAGKKVQNGESAAPKPESVKLDSKQRKENAAKTKAHVEKAEDEFSNPLARSLPRGDLVKFHSIKNIPDRLDAALEYEYANPRVQEKVKDDYLQLLSEGHRTPNKYEKDFLGSLFADKDDFNIGGFEEGDKASKETEGKEEEAKPEAPKQDIHQKADKIAAKLPMGRLGEMDDSKLNKREKILTQLNELFDKEGDGHDFWKSKLEETREEQGKRKPAEGEAGDKPVAPSYEEARKLPKGGAVKMDAHNHLAGVSEIMGRQHAINPDIIYDWAQEHNLTHNQLMKLGSKGTKVSQDLLDDVLSGELNSTKKHMEDSNIKPEPKAGDKPVAEDKYSKDIEASAKTAGKDAEWPATDVSWGVAAKWDEAAQTKAVDRLAESKTTNQLRRVQDLTEKQIAIAHKHGNTKGLENLLMMQKVEAAARTKKDLDAYWKGSATDPDRLKTKLKEADAKEAKDSLQKSETILDPLNVEIQQTAERLAKAMLNPNSDITPSSETPNIKDQLKASVQELGPEGLRKSIPTLNEAEASVLLEVLEELKKGGPGSGPKGHKHPFSLSESGASTEH